jgi:hypothetical protein
VSLFGDASLCYNSPVVQKSYIVMLTTWSSRPHQHFQHRPQQQFVARYDVPFGATVEFSDKVEEEILRELGEFMCLLLIGVILRFFVANFLRMYVIMAGVA